VRHEGEVREVALHGGVQLGRRVGVHQGRAVLVQDVHQLPGDDLGGVDQLLAPERVAGVRVLPREELGHLLGGELVLAHVREVVRQV